MLIDSSMISNLEIIEAVGNLDDAEDMMKYPEQFSGGQIQRITIARAISTKPRLIILDESVNSLNVLVQISIRSCIREEL